MSIKFYDTNLSYHFSCWIGRAGIAIDWWYDVGMRKRWWNPLHVRFHRQVAR